MQEKGSHPGEQVDTCQGQLQPGGVDGEQAGREASKAAVLAASDTVFDAGMRAVAGLQVLDPPPGGVSVAST